MGRALARLGIEHIPAYSPQARGRSERLNRTFQDRPVNELRVAGIATLEAANSYLAAQFVPQDNDTFTRAPRDPASAFVALGEVDLDAILCHDETRIVARDNTISVNRRILQIDRQAGRRSCAGLQVTVRHHLDGRITISQGARALATFALEEPVATDVVRDRPEEHRPPPRHVPQRPTARPRRSQAAL